MADKKISDLGDLPTPAAADLFVMVDDTDATTKKATLANMEAVIDHTNIIAGDGSDHDNINQAVLTTSGPTFDNLDITNDIVVGGSVDGIDIATDVAANTAHALDNTQAHTDYLLNSGADSAAGPLTIVADNSTPDQAYVPMVLYNTDDTPPAASGFPVGTLYVQYTA